MKKFIDFDSSDPRIIKRSKNIVTISIISFLVIILFFTILTSSNKNEKIKIQNSKNPKNKIDIANSLNVNVEDEWLSKSENNIKSIQDEIKLLKKSIEEQEKLREEEKERYNKTIDSLASELANVKMMEEKSVSNVNNYQYNEYGEIISASNNIEIQTISINLESDSNITSTNNYNDLENYIPAGSYVVAKMLSGADVSTGVSSQNDPNNMMFEIISPAFAPKFKGKKQEIKKVEGCRIMGAAVGQLWTEKAYIRLLKMSCSFEKGKVSEFNVKGYVTSFAKEGIRGKVVSREGYFTSLAFLAGAIEGIADITKTAYSPTIEFQTGIPTESLKTSDVAKQGVSGGFGKAAEMLSDYYIKRAEQYQSVVDVPTGIEVEIVFQDGVDLKTNIGFKVKPNEVSRQLGSQMGQDMNSNNSKSNVYINNNQVF